MAEAIEITRLVIEKLILPLTATFVGAWLAFNNMRKKQKSDDEKQKLSHSIRWFLEAENCTLSLYELKKRYSSMSDESIYRGLTLKISNNIHHKVEAKETTNLSFMLEQDSDIDRLGFRNYFRINRLFKAYNQAIQDWEKINNLKIELNPIMESLLDNNSKIHIDRHLIEAITPAKLTNYLLLFEQTISLTERCISDFLVFLDDFPAILNEHIDLQLLSRKPMGKYVYAPEVISCLQSQFKEFTQEQYHEVRNIICNHKKWCSEEN